MRPNYIPSVEMLGSYLEDLGKTGVTMVWAQTLRSHHHDHDHDLDRRVANHLEKHGFSESHHGMENKAYTVWDVNGDTVTLVSKRDFSYQFFTVNRADLQAALDLKYEGAYFVQRATLGELCARYE